MVWEEINKKIKEGIEQSIIRELHANYSDLKTWEDWEMCIRSEKSVLPPKILEWLEKEKVFERKEFDFDLFYELVIYPMAYPSVSILNNSLERPRSYYWRSRLINLENQILNIASSIGRLCIKQNGIYSYRIGYRKEKDLFLIPILSQESLAINDDACVIFSDYSMYHGKENYGIKSILKDDENIIMKLNPSSNYGNLLPMETKFNSCCSDDNVVLKFNYPESFETNNIRMRDLINYDINSKFGKLNVSPSIHRRAEKENTRRNTLPFSLPEF